MKKFTLIITLGLFGSMMGIMSCGDGGSDEDRQKAIQDSIRQADSIAAIDAARIADSIASADSVRIADSLAALEEEGARVPSAPSKKPTANNGGDNTPPPPPVVEETPKTNGTPSKSDRNGDGKTDAVKPTKGDRGNTGTGDGKTGTTKPGKRNR